MKRIRITLPAWVIVWMLLGSVCQGKPYQAYEGPRQVREEVVLALPDDIAILAIDGKPVWKRGHLLTPSIEEIRFLPGTHQLKLRYQELWDHDQGDEFDKLRSTPAIVTFKAESAGTYTLDHPRPQTMDEAREYELMFDGSKISFRRTGAPPAALEEPQPAPAPERQSAVDLLKYGWDKASPEERAAFLQWTESNR